MRSIEKVLEDAIANVTANVAGIGGSNPDPEPGFSRKAQLKWRRKNGSLRLPVLAKRG